MNTYTINEEARCYHFDIKKLVYVLNEIAYQNHYEVSKLERIHDETGECIVYFLLFIDHGIDDSREVQAFESDKAIRTYLIDTLKYANDIYNK